jgi:hypothetical protein
LKRIYIGTEKSPERRALEQEALLHLRALRARFKKELPGTLEDIRARYEKAQKSAASPPPSLAPLPPEAEIPIDREKNMRTVAAFLKLRGISPDDLKRPN